MHPYIKPPITKGRSQQFSGEWLLEFFEDHFDAARRFSYYLCGDTYIAADATERAFVRLWAFREKLVKSRVLTMLYSLIHGITLKELGDRNVSLQLVNPIDISSPDQSAEVEPFSPKELNALGVSLSRISELSRVSLLMNKLDGTPIQEIGRRLSYSDSVIERKMGQAVRSLSESIGEGIIPRLRSLAIPQFPILKEDSRGLLATQIEKTYLKERRKARFISFAALAIVFIVVASSLIEWRFATELIRTKAGKQAFKMLPDSSIIILQPESSLKLKRYSWADTRKVSLTGEANFFVKKNDKVFLVELGNQSAWSSNGHFNVSYRSPWLKVECVEGLVHVDLNHDNPLLLSEGMAIVAESQHSPNGAPVHPARIIAWDGVERYYDQVPLSIAISDIEARFSVLIGYQDFNPANIIYTGFIDLNNLKYSLDAITKPLGLIYTIDGQRNRVLLIRGDSDESADGLGI